jgi:hypothetical protein
LKQTTSISKSPLPTLVLLELNIGGGFLVDNEATAAAETDAVNLHFPVNSVNCLLAGEYSELQC